MIPVRRLLFAKVALAAVAVAAIAAPALVLWPSEPAPAPNGLDELVASATQGQARLIDTFDTGETQLRGLVVRGRVTGGRPVIAWTTPARDSLVIGTVYAADDGWDLTRAAAQRHLPSGAGKRAARSAPATDTAGGAPAPGRSTPGVRQGRGRSRAPGPPSPRLTPDRLRAAIAGRSTDRARAAVDDGDFAGATKAALYERITSRPKAVQFAQPDAQPLVVIFDANCPYCRRLWETLTDGLGASAFEAAGVEVYWVPIVTSRHALGRAVAILDGGYAALERNFERFDGNVGGVEAVADSELETAVWRNTALMAAVAGDRLATPMLMWRTDDGIRAAIGAMGADEVRRILDAVTAAGDAGDTDER